MRYVDTDKLIKFANNSKDKTIDANDIARFPPADVVEVVRCKDCRWGRKVCGNIECFVDSNIPPGYHGYDWFCPNGERRTDEQIHGR